MYRYRIPFVIGLKKQLSQLSQLSPRNTCHQEISALSSKRYSVTVPNKPRNTCCQEISALSSERYSVTALQFQIRSPTNGKKRSKIYITNYILYIYI